MTWGGGKIITIRPTDRPSDQIKRRCRALPVPEGRFGKSWHDYYSSVELFLGDALDLAEQHVGGYTHSLLKENTQLVLYSEPYANAMIYGSDSEIVVFINDGLVDLVEGTVRGMGMKTVPLQVDVFKGTLGVNFDEWLESMRTPRYLWGDRALFVGPDSVDAPGFDVAWFYSTRKEALALYGFIFAHELAHLKARDIVGEPDLALESRRDLDALRSMENARVMGYADASAVYVSALMLAMSYHEKYWEEEIRKAGYLRFEGARPLLHARDWKRRGQAILTTWRSAEWSISTQSKRAVHDWLSRLYSLRGPVYEHVSTEELSTGLEVEPLGDAVSVSAEGTVRYRYRMVNKNSVPVRIVVEVQSRVYFRDGRVPVSKMAPRDAEEKRSYMVVDDSVHELTLDVGAAQEIAGEVSGLSNDEIYGRLKLRVVSVSENEH